MGSFVLFVEHVLFSFSELVRPTFLVVLLSLRKRQSLKVEHSQELPPTPRLPGQDAHHILAVCSWRHHSEREEKDKSRVSELLQGLAFSDDSEAEEDNESGVQPQRKKLKVSTVPEKNWTKRDIKPNFPSWSALDSGLLNLKSEKLNPVELFELFFDDETFNLIVNETNNYASQKNVNLEVTVQEMWRVFGVLLWSGLVRHPRRGMYWEISDADQTLVRNAIKRDRFELIFLMPAFC